MPRLFRLLNAGQLVQQVLVLQDQGLPTRTPAAQVLLPTHVYGRRVMMGGVLCMKERKGQNAKVKVEKTQ